MAHFIGTEALQQIAVQIMPEIAMSAYYNRQRVFDKFYIKVISGVQFKNIKYLLLRKGHTSRRKEICAKLNSQAGTLLERELVTYLAWNRYRDNKSAYREYPIATESGNSYPESEAALRAVMANYADDLYDNVWHGDHTIEQSDANAYLGLFDGFFTNMANDVINGYVKPIHLTGTITRPVNSSDHQAWDLFEEFIESWDPHLQTAEKVIVGMNSKTAAAIVAAYGNAKNNNKDCVRLENGNIAFLEYPNIEIAHDATLGIGSKMFATLPYNLEYGVDTENAENGCSVQVGSDDDADDIFFQPQSAQGTRIFNITPSAFAVTDAAITPVAISGEYVKNTFSVLVNDADAGSVTVNGSAPDNTVEYQAGTTLALVATAETGFKFVKWSDGNTSASRTVVTKGQLESIVAFFAAN